MSALSLRAALGIASSALIVPVVATAQAGILTGVVSDSAGRPIAAAQIVASLSTPTRQATSNGAGRFRFQLDPGTYQVQVRRIGYAPVSRSVEIRSGAESSESFVLAESVVRLDEQVVTASAVAQSLRDAPASISVIDREDLLKRPVREDLTDLLASAEGVSLSRSGNLRTVQIRGLGMAYTLFLVDGKRVNSTANLFRGNDFDSGWLPAEAIERIEVVRGPMSSLYGSDAIGGVINIITRRVGTRWSGSVSGEYTLQENRAAGDAYRTGLYLSGPIVSKVLSAKLIGSFDRREADGAVNPQRAGGAAPLPGFEEKKNRSFRGELAWVLGPRSDVTAGYGFTARDHGGFRLDRHDVFAAHRGQWTFGTSEVKLNFDAIKNHTGNVTGQTNPNTANNVVGDGKLSMPWSRARQTITVGGDFRYQRLEDPVTLGGRPGAPASGIESVSQFALFLEDEIAILDNLRLTLGNRYDNHENFGGNHSPRAYLVYRPVDALTIKAGLARAFKAPTLLQNSPDWGSVSCGSPTTGCYIVGSAELEPETSTSKEVGALIAVGRVEGGVTVFQNDLENMIDISNRTNNRTLAPTLPNFVGFLPDGRPIFAYQNINNVRSRGVEATLRVMPVEALTLRANYTHLDSEQRGEPDRPVAYQPKHTLNAGADLTVVRGLQLNASATSLSEQYLFVPVNGVNPVLRDGYVMFDAGAAAQVGVLTVRGGVLNLGNKQILREVVDDYNEEGRRFFLSVTARF